MRTSSSVTIASAVEGPLDEAVVRHLIQHVGAIPGAVYGKQGKPHLLKNIQRYNAAARHTCWLVLTDLDHSAACAPELHSEWLPSPDPRLYFRIAVRTVEAWLLADRQRLARFLSIPMTRIPPDPEVVDHPKEFLVNLARRSQTRAIREDMVPTQRGGRQVGPAYTSQLITFVEDAENGWRPGIAAKSSDSLRRCLACLQRLVTSSQL
jgi:hypothetical protein